VSDIPKRSAKSRWNFAYAIHALVEDDVVAQLADALEHFALVVADTVVGGVRQDVP
jgi:precorrin isomerase